MKFRRYDRGQTDKHTHTHIQTHTDTLITILRFPIGGVTRCSTTRSRSRSRVRIVMRLRFVLTILALYKFVCMYVCGRSDLDLRQRVVFSTLSFVDCQLFSCQPSVLLINHLATTITQLRRFSTRSPFSRQLSP